MSIFFQNAQNHGFCNFDFWFLSRGKMELKTTFYVNAGISQWKNERISLNKSLVYKFSLYKFSNFKAQPVKIQRSDNRQAWEDIVGSLPGHIGLEIMRFRKNHVRFFSIYVSFLRYFKQNCAPFFHVKIPYLI